MKRLKGLAIAASLVMFTVVGVLPAMAEMTTIYGTVNIGNYDRDGHDKRTKHRFNAPVEGNGVIVIRSVPRTTAEDTHRHDGDHDRNEKKESKTFGKVKIELNGEEVAEQRHFDKGVEELRYDVNLLSSNTMKVKVKGCRQCSLQLSVLGSTDTQPPVPPAVAPPTPPPLF